MTMTLTLAVIQSAEKYIQKCSLGSINTAKGTQNLTLTTIQTAQAYIHTCSVNTATTAISTAILTENAEGTKIRNGAKICPAEFQIKKL